MAEHPVVLLDTSCLIDPPAALADLADSAAVSTLSIAELAYGLHIDDPMQAAQREARYRMVLRTLDPVPYSDGAAHWYGALAALVRRAGRNPRPRRIDLLLASVAADLSVPLATRDVDGFRDLDSAITVVQV